jgi:tetratricopeptide (TPR) repeat protein
LATELATEITGFQDIRVLILGPEDRGRPEADIGARFANDGSIRKDSAGIKVAIQLIDLATRMQVWADTNESEFKAERAISLNPNSLIMMAELGYLLTLLGDWKRGSALIRKAIENNPYYYVIVHHALWVDWMRWKDYEKAYLETLHFRTPLLFWDPLIKAATLGLLGRIQEGKKARDDLLKLKPDFSSRGRVLIKHQIKFDDILARTVEGLNKVGLSIEK